MTFIKNCIFKHSPPSPYQSQNLPKNYFNKSFLSSKMDVINERPQNIHDKILFSNPYNQSTCLCLSTYQGR